MKIVAFDTETKGLDWWDPEQQAFLASWADENGEYVADLTVHAEVVRFVEALESADVIVAHNLSFDVHQVRETLGLDILELDAELHDTDLMSRVLFPEGQRKGERGGHGLKNLAMTFLDESAGDAEKAIEEMADAIKVKLKSQGGYYLVWAAYPDVMEHYAKQDARVTYDLFTIFQKELTKNEQAATIYELERQVAPVLIRAESRGIALDQSRVESLHREYEDRAQDLRTELARELGEEALGGVGSEAALLEALLGLGVPLHRTTPTSGELSTSVFALQEFEDDFPILQKLSEFRQVEKFLSTYLGPMRGRDVVHTSFRQIGAWTGRMSSARPNMQNIPKRAGVEVRSVFVPRDGHSFVVLDYESIEVRLLAWYLNDPGYRQLITDGLDPHAWMADQIWGGGMEAYWKESPERKDAKNVLFAITYGAGGRRITDMLKLDPGPYYDEHHPAIVTAREQGRFWPQPGPQYREARALIRKIKDALPGYKQLNSRIRRKIESVGYVNTIIGRKNPVNRDKAYVGLNALIQGSAADIMKQGLVNVARAVDQFGGVPLLVVHDEVVVEVPTENAVACAQAMVNALCSACPLDAPLSVEGGIVHSNYSEA